MGRLAQRSTGRLGYLDVDDGGGAIKALACTAKNRQLAITLLSTFARPK